MEGWIIRAVAALCATGALALFWMLGVFAAVPWHEGRLLALDGAEIQLLGVPLLVGGAASWGTLHLLAIADRDDHPAVYGALRAVLIVLALAAFAGGSAWTLARIA